MKKYNLLLIFACIFLTTSLFSAKFTNVSDSLELLEFYNSTGGKNWHADWGWSDGKLPVWEWYGVAVSYEIVKGDTVAYVAEIDLQDNNLNGYFSDLKLPKLWGLFLGKNHLKGTVPIPNQDKFEWFDISNNKLLFHDFEPNFNTLKDLYVFIYEPQDTIVPLEIQQFPNYFRVENTYKNPNVTYRWLLNNKIVQGIASDTLLVYNMTASITCVIVSSVVPDLEIKCKVYPAVTVELISPPDSAVLSSAPNLVWRKINYADSYSVKSVIKYSNSSITRYDVATDTSFYYPDTADVSNCTIEWSVAAQKNEFTGAYSKSRMFTSYKINEYTALEDSLSVLEFMNNWQSKPNNRILSWSLGNPVYKWEGIKTRVYNVNGEKKHKITSINIQKVLLKFTELSLRLDELDTLILFDNGAEYRINTEKIHLPKLKYVNLSTNKFIGNSSEFNKISSLENLELINSGLNSFIGTNLPNLIRLDVSSNNFDNLPNGNQFPSLKILEMNNCTMGGSFSNLSFLNLQSLNLFNCKLDKFENNTLPELLILNISSNKLSDFEQLKKYPKLMKLYIANCSFSGDISTLGMNNLIELYATSNKFYGAVAISAFPNLEIIDLSYNNYTGPLFIDNHPKLRGLDLSNNKFNGKIPDLDFPNLTAINITNNLFEKFGKFTLPSLYTFNASNNNLHDTIPDFTKISKFMTTSGIVNLPSNKLIFEDIAPNHFTNKQIKNYILANQKVVYKIKVSKSGYNYYLELDYDGIADKFEWYDQNNILVGNGLIFSKSQPITKLRCKISFSKVTHTVYYSEYFNPFPSKIAPANNSKDVALNPTFKWTKVDYAKNYTLAISENKNMTNGTAFDVSDTIFKLPIELLPNRKYFWSVNFTSLEDKVSATFDSVYTFETINLPVYAFPKDSLELVRIYNTLNGPNWKSKVNWLSDSSISKWSNLGLKVARIDTNYYYFVTNLSLGSNNLKGEIDFINLDSLRSIDLTDNVISGKFPIINSTVIKDVYASMNAFTSGMKNAFLPTVNYLALSNNSFEEEIDEITGDSLQYLYISKNKLHGIVPQFTAPNLTWFTATDNNFDDILPVIYHEKVSRINLLGNKIKAGIPEFNCQNLTYLDLSKNQFSGKLPAMNNNKLSILILLSNNLNGEIENISLPSLSEIYLDNNKFSGKMPNFNSMALKKLTCNNNKFLFNDFMDNLSYFTNLVTFNYSPQDTILRLSAKQLPGGERTISVVIEEHIQNSYKWYKDSVYLGDSLNKRTISVNYDTAKYHCEVYFKTLPKLIISSELKSYKDLTISVDEEIFAEDIEIYPNPTSSILNIKLNKMIDDKYKIIAINGSLMQSGDSYGETLSIDVNGLPSGVYYFELEKHKLRTKFVKF